MPVHDWTRVFAGTFHDFHHSWITHLKETLNGGLLPEGYYAQSEQQAGRKIPDILALHAGEHAWQPGQGGAATVAEARPRAQQRVTANPNASYRNLRRTVAIRHVSGHRLVALVEVVSPGNKDRRSSVNDFVGKLQSALLHDIHVLLIDLFPPGRFDPEGLHPLIWDAFGGDEDESEGELPPGKPLMLAAYAAGVLPEAYLEPVAVGDALPDRPLFIEPGGHVNVPLEPTYEQAYRGVPGYWRGVIEGRSP